MAWGGDVALGSAGRPQPRAFSRPRWRALPSPEENVPGRRRRAGARPVAWLPVRPARGSGVRQLGIGEAWELGESEGLCGSGVGVMVRP